VYPGSNETIVFNLSPEVMYWGTRQLVDVWGALLAHSRHGPLHCNVRFWW
jgi:hypothetical protein